MYLHARGPDEAVHSFMRSQTYSHAVDVIHEILQTPPNSKPKNRYPLNPYSSLTYVPRPCQLRAPLYDSSNPAASSTNMCDKQVHFAPSLLRSF